MPVAASARCEVPEDAKDVAFFIAIAVDNPSTEQLGVSVGPSSLSVSTALTRGVSFAATPTSGTSFPKKLSLPASRGARLSISPMPSRNSTIGQSGAFSTAAAAAAATAINKYGITLEWQQPLENPLGLFFDQMSGKVYSGVYGGPKPIDRTASPQGQKVGGILSSVGSGSVTPPIGVTGAKGVLFGSLSVRSDAIIITYEPTVAGTPCDSLVAQAILRCVQLVAKDPPDSEVSSHESAVIPISISFNSNLGANQSKVKIQL